MAQAARQAAGRKGHGVRNALGGLAVLALLLAMALSTTVVPIGSERDVRGAVFSPEAFAAEQFPRIRTLVEQRAVAAPALAAAIAADKEAAIKAHGSGTGTGAVMPVTLAGTVGEGRSGIFEVAVPDMPPGTKVRVQTGPAINGTELRDFPGDIAFGDFTNQIEFQNASAAINDAMKAGALSGLDRDALKGRQITVTGVFRLINPKNWLVTPVTMNVQ